MNQPANPFESLPEVSGDCATHGPWSVRLPPMLAANLRRSGADGCPACGLSLIAAKRAEDMAESDLELASARQAWSEKLLGRASVPGQFRDASLGGECINSAHLEVVDRLRNYVGHWPARLRSGASLVLHGPSGLGKSHMSAATLKAILAQGARGTFLRQDALSAMVRACYGPKADKSEDEILAELLGMDFLALDELGVGKTTEHEIRMLNSVIAGRHEEMRPTLITSNLKRVEIEAYLGDRLKRRMSDESRWKWIGCEWPVYRAIRAVPHQEQAA